MDRPAPLFTPPPPVPTTAVLSLVFGILSVICLGFVAGIPAIVLGVTSRSRGGRGMAVAGIATGAAGTLLSLILIGLGVLGALAGRALPEPGYGQHASSGELTTFRLFSDGRPITTQLQDEAAKRFASDHRTTVAVVGAVWCKPCQEIERQIATPELRRRLAHLHLVEIDLDAYGAQLDAARLHVVAVPTMFIVGPDGRPTDGLHEGSVGWLLEVERRAAAERATRR